MRSSNSFGRITPSELPILRMVVFMTASFVVTGIITSCMARYNKDYNGSVRYQQPVHQPLRSLRNNGSGREDFGGSGFQHGIVVLRWDDTAGDDENIVVAGFFQRFLQLGDKRQVPRRQ